MVHGRVRVDVWEREDHSNSVTWIIDATFVGHDLTKGTSSFAKTARLARDPRENEAVRELVHGYEADGPQLDAAGDPVPSPESAGGSSTGTAEGSTAA